MALPNTVANRCEVTSRVATITDAMAAFINGVTIRTIHIDREADWTVIASEIIESHGRVVGVGATVSRDL